jgi:hypothetical protein
MGIEEQKIAGYKNSGGKAQCQHQNHQFSL